MLRRFLVSLYSLEKKCRGSCQRIKGDDESRTFRFPIDQHLMLLVLCHDNSLPCLIYPVSGTSNMIPIWVLTAWHYTSLVAGVFALILLTWQGVRGLSAARKRRVRPGSESTFVPDRYAK